MGSGTVPPSLRDFQSDLAEALLSGAPGAFDGRRFNVYLGNYRGAHVRSLRLTFPACARLVGEEFFDRLALECLRRRPPGTENLNDYGARFPEFLAGFEAVSAVPYLPDVARLELLLRRAARVRDDRRFDFHGLAAVPEALQSALLLVPSDSLFLLSSEYPVHSLWEAGTSGEEGTELCIPPEGARLVVWGEGTTARVRRIPDEEWAALDEIVRGAPLGELCERRPAAAALVPRFIAERWIVSFTLAS